MTTLRTSIATVSVPGDLPTKLKAIAAAGFDGIEIFEQDFIADAGSPRDVGAMVRDHGLEITLFQPFRDFESLPEPRRAKAFDRAERKFDLMQELGVDLVLVCSSCDPDSLGGIDRAAADFHELGERAAKRGLRVGYEALCWGRHVNDHRDAWEVVRRADHANVGLILDSFHSLARRIDNRTIRAIPGDKIFFVQLADAPLIEMDLLYWSRHFRNMPGEGDLDVTGFMQAVAAAGYTGPLSLEIFNDQFRSGNARMVAEDGYRSLVQLADEVRLAEPSGAVSPAPLPARQRPKGVEFIEFTAQGEDRARTTALLSSMGFAPAGKHVSKNVELWRQGGINVVVNAETSGFANAAYAAHGASICDVGLKVGDAGAAAERAARMGAKPFAQPVGPGELEIPAVRSVGGSVLHFIDEGAALSKVWETEFPGAAATAGDDAGLTRIDHLAETMNYGEMLSWTLFYAALFDMQKSPMVDVIDPDGLVRSQALESPDGALRITLNGAETHRTLAGKFLADSFGGVVQHVAFATGDIFASVEAMKARGFQPLPMPRNYYDDLAARHDIEPALLERMRALDILYDRDAGGEFFQCYSRPWGDGMFFEVLERRGDYTGYGAPNAPFRIAAQKRLMRHGAVPKG
ncbi:bifunctional sugar phosphate isomerase/epimerase/4-hydroxyphenylpyruvate dioxygenase family protein [Rhodovulum sp. DZ06]|uniref:bifunctional sugar phosphate isomerase/epimerase/4-hydroxyphenylpyruvate dioxygenase family protein n=1 Tax=Rhodovulum sp. DZ06 TaxID=3425126 RepID=UPI003D32AF0F